jgi:transglutaminase-like putative cysteine protease
MSAEDAFYRTVRPTLELLLRGREDVVLAAPRDGALDQRIEELASKCTEGELTPEERKEYEAYVRANHFVAVIMRVARSMKVAGAS